MRIGVVLGSTRRQRLGERVCRLVMAQAAQVPGATFEVLDLADYALPFFDEPAAPLRNHDRQLAPGAKRWLDDVAAMDGLVFLTPEYNYAPPAVLKNALDFLADEGSGKPAAVLSYSDTSHGGNIAGHQLQLTLSKLGFLPVPRSLPLAHADRLLDADGNLVEQSDWAAKVARFLPWSLGELVRYAGALRTLREPVSA
jgi:NAD(P)H-dependent FMN reductase